MTHSPFPYILFDWGGTLMSEDGPPDIAMAYWPEVTAVSGAEEALASLAPHHRLCVATNASVSGREQIEMALDRVSLGRYISDIFCFTEIGARKDTLEFWAAVTSRLQAATSDIAMVGDSLEQDVIAPRRFGIFSVWFNEDNRQRTTSLQLPTIHRLSELGPLVSDRT